jgi:hypothetical protein
MLARLLPPSGRAALALIGLPVAGMLMMPFFDKGDLLGPVGPALVMIFTPFCIGYGLHAAMRAPDRGPAVAALLLLVPPIGMMGLMLLSILLAFLAR